MTLNKIDIRLVLLKDYLTYIIDFKITNILYYASMADQMLTYKNTGILFVTQGQIPVEMNFNQWLFVNGHEDLIDYHYEYRLSVDPYQRGIFVYDDKGVIVWKESPFGSWYMARRPVSDEKFMKDVMQTSTYYGVDEARKTKD